MGTINLEEAKIKVDDEWLSVEELTQRIQEKMETGDMKFAGLASALEQLNHALENSRTLEISTVLTRDEYQRLKEIGGGDDRECVRQAIAAFIGSSGSAEANGKKRAVIRCSKCQTLIEIPPGDERPSEVKCPNCNAVGRLKAKHG
ncbi:hypothetical protein D3OALGA1CA_832 [Olavius algarvensis associated proteobacterium Delta 3]|nr:hypothetical protein D3OALGA1CA_832 [Olavius algarvensis associated proteobacterium Delta 3]CAB5142832.1 hypothetical protein D3OALGB2SA_4335 [Olavius algarvensis associated proteobacterium Delta 3]